MKTRFIFLLLMASLFAGWACKDSGKIPSEDDPPSSSSSGESEKINLKEYKRVRLHQSIEDVQPMTGIVLWPDLANAENDSYGNSITLEFSYCLPSDVVVGKEDGQLVYDWSSFEALLEDISSRNHQAIVRFRYEYPGIKTNGVRGGTAVPNYIKERSDYKETYNENPGGDGPTYYADWSNEELQWFTTQFYTDFAEKYDEDNRIAFVEAGFGHWSEYHIYGTPVQLGQNFPSFAYQKDFLTHLSKVFRRTPWLVSIDMSDEQYSPLSSDPSIKDAHFGLFDDSFMHSEHELSQGDGYNEQCWINVGMERWEQYPAGGEISYYDDKDQKEFLNPEGLYGFTWEEASAKYHLSFIIGNDAPGTMYGTPERVKEAGIAVGYKFKIEDFQVKGDSSAVLISNHGIAPIYRDAYVAVNGKRSDFSLKGLLPGTSRLIKIGSGGENPELSIVCDDLLSGQTIGFEADIEE